MKKTIGQMIQERRNKLGITQERLAEIAGVSRPYINQIESRGGERIGAEVLYWICIALGESIDDFMYNYKTQDDLGACSNIGAHTWTHDSEGKKICGVCKTEEKADIEWVSKLPNGKVVTFMKGYLPKEPQRWRTGQHSGYFYYLTKYGDIRRVFDYYCEGEDELWKIGNYFPSNKQAELYKLRLESMLEMEGIEVRSGTIEAYMPQKYRLAWETDLYDPNLFKDE